MLLVCTGEVCSERRTELFPRPDRSGREVHEPSPGWPGQGYMEVAGHDGLVAICCCDGGDVNLHELRRVSSIVELLWQLWAELGWPGHRAEMFCKRGAAHSGYRGTHSRPGISRGLGGCCFQVSAKVATLDVESSVARAIDGDASVLARTSAAEFCPQVLGTCSPYRGRVHRRGCPALTLVVAMSHHAARWRP